MNIQEIPSKSLKVRRRAHTLNYMILNSMNYTAETLQYIYFATLPNGDPLRNKVFASVVLSKFIIWSKFRRVM